MKYFFYGLLSILILILLMILSLISPPFSSSTTVSVALPEYHIALLTQGSTDPFWNALITGAASAGSELGITVEMIDIPPNDVDRMAEAIDRAILSDTNAIALQPIDDPKIAESLKLAESKGIHILTFENDAFTLEGVPTVGSTSYQIGQNAAKLAIAATGGKAHIAFLLNDKQSEDTRYKSLKLQGFLEKISDYPDMILTSTYTVTSGLFEADKLTRTVLAEHPEVDLIICTDERRTPGVAQTIVDLNAVGDIQIVGFGSMAQTIKYIEKGVIYGTICADGYEIGYTVVNSLYKLIENEPISESHATTIYTYTLKNLNSYYERFSKTPSAQ